MLRLCSCWMAELFSTIGDKACHPFASLRAGSERSEGSGSLDEEILRCAQDDSWDTCQK